MCAIDPGDTIPALATLLRAHAFRDRVITTIESATIIGNFVVVVNDDHFAVLVRSDAVYETTKCHMSPTAVPYVNGPLICLSATNKHFRAVAR
jgi:hypothetical protein